MFSPDLLTKIEKCHDSVKGNKMVSSGPQLLEIAAPWFSEKWGVPKARPCKKADGFCEKRNRGSWV